MTQKEKLLSQILTGRSDANVNFNDLLNLLRSLGFEQRTRGSHHILTREGIEEIINLQPKGAKAKAYQVRQIRHLIVKYRLGGTT
jgi:predicted RNA binding protein YcfA (HicA-like mRNA interferase family)